jgi:Protein of unknown function (DUF2892)
MSTPTLERVPANTNRAINDEIARETIDRIARCAPSNRAIAARLRRLRREWDVERALEAGAASLVVAGTTLAAVQDRRWRWLPAVVGGFLLQHAIQGWCPPLPVFRRLGFRTADEIARERYALKAMRGDFAGLGLDRGPGSALRAFRAARP